MCHCPSCNPFVIILQAKLDNGYFTRQTRDARVHTSVTVTNVVTGISRRYSAAFTTTTTTSPSSPTTIPTPTTTSSAILGTLFAGYDRVRAGSGKQGGIGDSAWTSAHVVLLTAGEERHRLDKSDYPIKTPATNLPVNIAHCWHVLVVLL